MNIIKVKNLIHDYNKGHTDQKRAINDVTMNIKKGDFVAIIGHNGSGKSSLARHLNAMLLPTSGAVIVDEIDTQNREFVFLQGCKDLTLEISFLFIVFTSSTTLISSSV